MVRNYKRKTDRGIGGKYSLVELQSAIEEVKMGTMSYKQASVIYGVPVTTLVSKVKGWRNRHISSPLYISGKNYGGGRHTDLSIVEEKSLAENLSLMAKWGFGLMAEEVLDVVQDYVLEHNLKTRFKNGRPGRDWLRLFIQRQKLSLKKPEIQEASRFRQEQDPYVVYGFLDLVEEMIKELGIDKKPENIYNADETAFFSDATQGKIICKKGFPARRMTQGSGKSSTTVLACVNASGEILPPLIIHAGKHLWSSWLSAKGFPGTSYRATKNGWMDQETFFFWFTSQFIPSIPLERRPVLLIYDGHLSHISLQLVSAARQEKIHIIKLPPHSSHILQPLDVSVFRCLKYQWNVELVNWQRKNSEQNLNKTEFSELLGKIWKQISAENIRSGFKYTGIFDGDKDFPVNKNIIGINKFNPLKLQAYKKWKSDSLSSNQIMPENDQQHENFNDEEQIADLATSTSVVSQATSPFKEQTFESLLLQKVQRGNKNKVQRKLIRHAECITRDDYLHLLTAAEKEMKKKILKKISIQRNVLPTFMIQFHK